MNAHLVLETHASAIRAFEVEQKSDVKEKMNPYNELLLKDRTVHHFI